MHAVFKTLEKYVIGVLVLWLVVWLLLPSVWAVFQPFMKYFLVVVMYLSFLKIDLDKLIDQVVHPVKWVYIVVISMIILPIVLYVVTQALGFSSELSIAVLLVSAMPAAMATPALSDIFKGNTPLNIIILLVWSLLTPFLVPWITKSFLGINVSYSLSAMMINLAWMIFIPWILAQETRNFFPKRVHKTMHYYTGIEIILLFFLVLGPVGKAAPYIYGHVGEMLGAILRWFVISILMHLVAWHILPKAKREERVSSTLAIAYLNLPLAIVFANTFFTPMVAVLVVLYDIPWNLMLIPFKYFLDKKSSKHNEQEQDKVNHKIIKKSTKAKVPNKLWSHKKK